MNIPDIAKGLFVLLDLISRRDRELYMPGSLKTLFMRNDDIPFRQAGLKEGDIIVVRTMDSNAGTVLCRVLNIDIMGRDVIKAVLSPMTFVRIEKEIDFNAFRKVKVSEIKFTDKRSAEDKQAMLELLKERSELLLGYMKDRVSSETRLSLRTASDTNALINAVLSFIDADFGDLSSAAAVIDTDKRARGVLKLIEERIIIYRQREHIAEQVQSNISDNQKKYFLNEQLKVIKKELGYTGDMLNEYEELKDKIVKAGMSRESEKKALYELNKLSTMPPISPEATVVRNYLDWLINIPWQKRTKDNLDIKLAEGILEKNHFGLKKIKERVLEYLAVLKLSKSVKGQILCFVGPPGVGKTSLGESIAQSLGRKFVRISLGGVRDEAEIRGHRKTYIGSMPGKIVQMMRRANVMNPVFMLDEVDKLGSDFKGDPSSALLEVLDPQLNHSFMDHYLEVEYDLSNVLFICTANIIHTIPPALRDRMEIINLPGYLEFEKFGICKKFLIPRNLKIAGLKKSTLRITDKAIEEIVKKYTVEAGVRTLEKQIAKIMRKVAKEVATGNDKKKFSVTPKEIEKYLGPAMSTGIREKKPRVGVANGLAWTQYGGALLLVETLIFPGTGKIQLTGQLGDVLKESANASISYLRKYADKYGIEKNFYEKYDIHIHLPEGAIPKDGPSAGITITASLFSALKNKAMNRQYAMTGEITLRGLILPIGGLAEKVVAAQSAGIENVVIPYDNKPQYNQLPKEAKQNINIMFIRTIDDALKLLFN